jgi:hypothetical protein
MVSCNRCPNPDGQALAIPHPRPCIGVHSSHQARDKGLQVHAPRLPSQQVRHASPVKSADRVGPASVGPFVKSANASPASALTDYR